MIYTSEYGFAIRDYIRKHEMNEYKINKHNFIRFVPMGLDIETTTQYEKDNDGNVISHYSNMYIWQLSFGDDVFIGRDFNSLFQCLELIIELICYDRQTIIFIQNQKFEFQFLSKELEEHFGSIGIFARKKRAPMRWDINNKIIFLDTFLLSGYSLEKLAQNYTKTQKMVGDLDYSVLRNSKTPISSKELTYCINDVIILKEYAQFYEKTYLSKNFMPMTATMISGQVVKDEIKNLKCSDYVNKLMMECYPKSKEQYDYIMSFYTGAYTHGMLRNLFCTLENGLSFDVKSEYPFCMMNYYYPMSEFRVLHDLSQWELFTRLKCCLIDVTFEGIKTKNGITTISKNHCENPKNARWDNGRLYSADNIRVHVTEIDLNILKKIYNIKKIKIHSLIYAERGKLPKYFRLAIARLFDRKEQLNGVQGKEIEYMQSKKDLNGQYGRCCTRLQFSEIVFENGWIERGKEIDFGSIWKGKNVLPQWAIYITAWARNLVLSMASDIEPDDYWYTDTDSIKCANKPYILELFEKRNRQIQEQNQEWIDELNLSQLFPNTDFTKLGTFAREDDLLKFKSLGSKRYICDIEKNGKVVTKSTIAGLPKKAFSNYCEKHNSEPYGTFIEDLEIDVEFSDKLCSYYCDEPKEFVVVDEYGNIEHCKTKSYVSLIPTTFKMSIGFDLKTLFVETNI